MQVNVEGLVTLISCLLFAVSILGPWTYLAHKDCKAKGKSLWNEIF